MKKEDITALGISEELADKIVEMAQTETQELTKAKEQAEKALATEKNERAAEVKKLNKTIADNTTAHETEKKTLSDELNSLKYSSAADKFLSKVEFSSSLAKEAVMAMLKEKHPELSEDGTISGADEFLKELQKTAPDAFKSAKQDPKIITGGGAAGGKMTKEEFDKLGYSERTKFFRENPDEYKKLTEQNAN